MAKVGMAETERNPQHSVFRVAQITVSGNRHAFSRRAETPPCHTAARDEYAAKQDAMALFFAFGRGKTDFFT